MPPGANPDDFLGLEWRTEEDAQGLSKSRSYKRSCRAKKSKKKRKTPKARRGSKAKKNPAAGKKTKPSDGAADADK